MALIEPHDLVCRCVNRAGQALPYLSRNAHQANRRVLLEMGCPFGVEIVAVFPHFFQIVIRFLRFIQAGIQRGDAEHHKKLVLEISALHFVPDVIQVHRLEAPLGDDELVGIASRHHVPLDGLPLPADVVAVKIRIEIIHSPDIGQRLVDHQIVLVKDMLRQRLGMYTQQLGTEGAAMDGKQLMKIETPRIRPAKNAVLRQGIGIADRAVAVPVRMLIVVIGDEEIHASAFFALLQRIQKTDKIPADPVVAVHHLEVLPLGVLQALVDACAVAAVFLMNGGDDTGIGICIPVCDCPGGIRGAIVNHDDLNPAAAGKQALDALFHVSLRIITGDGDG